MSEVPLYIQTVRLSYELVGPGCMVQSHKINESLETLLNGVSSDYKSRIYPVWKCPSCHDSEMPPPNENSLGKLMVSGLPFIFNPLGKLKQHAVVLLELGAARVHRLLELLELLGLGFRVQGAGSRARSG